MDFFERQAVARRRTVQFLLLFVFAIGGIVFFFYGSMTLVWEAGRWIHPRKEAWQPGWWWNGELLFWSAVYVGLFVIGGVILRAMALREGGGAVAEMLGGRALPATGGTPADRRLHNIVEEMAIASGTPKPQVYVLERERGINAFAAGYCLDDAAIAVTRGALEALNRDELQGVVAHEFSHIAHGDMRLNLRTICLLNGILAVHLAGLSVWRPVAGCRDWSLLSQGGAFSPFLWATAFLSFSLMTIGYVGVLSSMIIQRAVSRQREYLADAAAVQFTRNPSGLAAALKKIFSWPVGSRVWSPHSEEAAHLFFSKALGNGLAALLDSHPPLERRIHLLDPSFSGFEVDGEEAESGIDEAVSKEVAEAERGASETREEPAAFVADAAQAGMIAGIVGTLGEARFAEGKRLLRAIPETLRESAGEPAGAEAIFAMLLLAEEPEEREVQRAVWGAAADPEVWQEFNRLYPDFEDMASECRLPLLELALAGLRELSPEQARRFRETMEGAFAARPDGELFPVLAKRILSRFLRRRESGGGGGLRLAHPVTEEAHVILSALSHAGKKDTRKAWEAAKLRLPPELQRRELLSADRCGVDCVDAALKGLEEAGSKAKRWLLEAAEFCIASDERVAADEAELLRALCAVMDCPAPPLLGIARVRE